MTPQQVQTILQEFDRRARLVASRGDGSEHWQFDVGGHSYDLHYYPDDDTLVKRYVGGARAAREFATLQAMQKLHVPAARVVANLKGFRIGDRKGDACILVHDADATPLPELLAGPALDRAARLRTTASLVTLLESLHRERLCPVPLTLDAFARRGDGVVIVRDGAAKFEGVVTDARLHELDAATRAATTAPERLRLWRHFTDLPAPRRADSTLARSARRLTRDAGRADDATFGTIAFERGNERWIGRYLRHTPLALPWSVASRRTFARADWADALPTLIDDRTWPTFKDDEAAVVRGGTLAVGGTSLELVVKRPAIRPGARGFFDAFRPARVRRSWAKTWRMLGLGFRCEVPLLVVERRELGRVVDQLLVVERVPGPTLEMVELDAMSPATRERLLYACGRTLRRIVALGYTHRDAKHTNWIAWTDPADGVAKPVLIDLDGVRFVPLERNAGLARLVRAMRTRPDVTDADVAAIERGYAGNRTP